MTSRISAALRDYRFDDALILLYEMYVRKLPPKLGALQRWVRECDATSTVDTLPDSDAMKCLDLILRIAGGDAVKKNGGEQSGFELKQNAVWSARDDMLGEIKIWEKMSSGTLFGESTSALPSTFPRSRQTPPRQTRTLASGPSSVSLATFAVLPTCTIPRSTGPAPTPSASPHLPIDLERHLGSTSPVCPERSWCSTCSPRRSACRSSRRPRRSDSRRTRRCRGLRRRRLR